MKSVPVLIAITAFLFLFSAAFSADIQLPPPQKTGGTPLLEAIDQRASAKQADFPAGEISNEDLSTILWAASGHNRDGKLWTVPMAMGNPPYCKIYVSSKDGVYLYNWVTHSLKEISKDPVHENIPMQQFAKSAPMNLYIVADGPELERLKSPFGDEFGLVLAGAMSQNIYLACDAVGVGARLVYSIRRNEAATALRLDDGDIPYFAIIMGKK